MNNLEYLIDMYNYYCNDNYYHEAIAFLSDYFNDVSKVVITKIFNEENFNFNETFQRLENTKNKLKRPRKQQKITIRNNELLREIVNVKS